MRRKNDEDVGFVGMKWGKWRPFLKLFLSQTVRLLMDTTLKIALEDQKTHEGFKNGRFSMKMFLLKTWKPFSHLFAMPKFYRWLTVAPHGDGIFLKMSRISDIIFGSRPDAWYLTIFSSLINCYIHDGHYISSNTSPNNYLPILLS